jgi:hypothetical protein
VAMCGEGADSNHMTNNEKELVAALEADIQTWEGEAKFFETFVKDVEFSGRNAMPGREYARGLHKRIADHKALIEKVKKG